MSPGQRKYIERRLADFESRAVWVRRFASEGIEWAVDELPGLETRIAGLRDQIVDSGDSAS